MNRVTKLSTLILLEAQSLKESTNISNSIVLAEELTRDAIALATLLLSLNSNVVQLVTKSEIEKDIAA